MRVVIGAAAVLSLTWSVCSQGAESGCGQSLVDGTSPPYTSQFITPRQAVQPFYQWENNDGYCGEVTLIQAGMSNGQFMSQFAARQVCGTALSQSGPGAACGIHGGVANFNAQTLLQTPGTGVTGPDNFASAAQCAANAALSAVTYPYAGAPNGMAGYANFLSWIKQQVIAGNQVALGVLRHGGTDPQYDHEVTVMQIGTNHDPGDPTYYADDVLYFDDHGVYTLDGSQFTGNPAIPPGAGGDTYGCTPYVYGYSFASLAQTRAGANGGAAQAYSILIPSGGATTTYAGGSGYAPVSISGAHNYAYAVSGPADSDGVTLPVSLRILGPTVSNGAQNPADPVAGYNYENPMIGTSDTGRSCTNQRPATMTHLQLQATISGLNPGTSYNLYEYDLPRPSGRGSAAALGVPQSNFNANAYLATHVTNFTARHSTFTKTVSGNTGAVTVFRCVPASAP